MRVGLLITIVAVMVFSSQALFPNAERRIILDADTANEIDDLYAIVRLLNQDTLTVVGLNSAQWVHYLSGPRTVQRSQAINEDLLRIIGREDIPANLGAEEPMGKPWGGTDPKDSKAARFIIEQARATPEGEKLIVACIGASTNLASAIKMAPDIVPRIAVYVMAFRYDVERMIWDKDEFNVRRDLNAANFLLNMDGLELHVMTATTSIDLKFDQLESFAHQEKMGELGQYLTKRWKSHAPNAKRWVMWDLALIQALIHPDMATEIEVLTPPENTQRSVWVYDSIQTEAMEADFWETAMP